MNPLDSLFTVFSPLLSSPFCFLLLRLLLLAIAMVGAAASSCYASPLCTFFVAACMSLSHGGGDTRQAFGRSRRRRQQLGKCSGSGSILVSSCLEFKPCSHYNKNNKGNAFPLLGSNSLSLNRKQRKLNRATSSSSGINILLPKSQVLVSGYRLQADKLCFLCIKFLLLCFITQVLVLLSVKLDSFILFLF